MFILLFALLLVPVCAQDTNSTGNSTLAASPVNYIEDANVYDYFDMDNVMTDEFANSTYIFTENLMDYGVLTIEAPNTVFTANEGVVLENIAFDVKAENVTIENITFLVTKSLEDNDGSAIMTQADNTTVQNVVINYTALRNTEAYGIHVNGKASNLISGTRLINNLIYFVGNNDKHSDNFGIWLYHSINTLLENNTLISSFPLRSVNFNTGLMIGDAVAGIAVYNGKNLNMTNNNIFVEVNKATLTSYPTLDAIIIKAGENIRFINNTLKMEDFKTGIGMPNYLYGLDVYNIKNMLIEGNNFSVMTWGGALSAGTAYPIQLTGPLSNVTITDNDIYSISNGPNLGIYSTNYDGKTSLKIFNNRINVTGLAGEHEYALVAGIEVQDDNDYIVNNTIAVHSTSPVGENDNLYGISFRQKLEGDHNFVIKDNLIFTDGDVAVYLYASNGSTVINNIAVSSKEGIADVSYTALKLGPGEHERLTHYNNRVLSEYEYWSKILNEVDGGEDTTYTTPENVNNLDNNINAGNVPGGNNNPDYGYNPFYNGDSPSTGKPNVPSNVNDRNNNNHISDDFNDNAINPGDEPSDNPSGGVNPGDRSKAYDDVNPGDRSKAYDDVNPGDRSKAYDDVNPGDKPKEQQDVINPGDRSKVYDDVDPGDKPREQKDVINPGDEPIDNPTEVENPGDDYVEESGSNTNSNPGDKSIVNPYHYDETKQINGTRIDDGGVSDYNQGMSFPGNKQDDVTSNTDSGSVITNSFGGQSSIVVNTTANSPSDTGEDSAASSEKSSTSSNVESVGSDNPPSANSVSKAYEILENFENIVKNPQNLMLSVVLILIVLALLVVGYKRKSKEDEY